MKTKLLFSLLFVGLFAITMIAPGHVMSSEKPTVAGTQVSIAATQPQSQPNNTPGLTKIRWGETSNILHFTFCNTIFSEKTVAESDVGNYNPTGFVSIKAKTNLNSAYAKANDKNRLAYQNSSTTQYTDSRAGSSGAVQYIFNVGTNISAAQENFISSGLVDTGPNIQTNKRLFDQKDEFDRNTRVETLQTDFSTDTDIGHRT